MTHCLQYLEKRKKKVANFSSPLFKKAVAGLLCITQTIFFFKAGNAEGMRGAGMSRSLFSVDDVVFLFLFLF